VEGADPAQTVLEAVNLNIATSIYAGTLRSFTISLVGI
jgi:hypothetical protein